MTGQSIALIGRQSYISRIINHLLATATLANNMIGDSGPWLVSEMLAQATQLHCVGQGHHLETNAQTVRHYSGQCFFLFTVVGQRCLTDCAPQTIPQIIGTFHEP